MRVVLLRDDETIIKKRDLIELHRLVAFVPQLYKGSVGALKRIAQKTKLPVDVEEFEK